MTLCVVCRRDGAASRLTHRGDEYGPACDGCEVLAWESFWNRRHPKSVREWEPALLAWRTRRHLAKLDGRAFLEPMPVLPGEMLVDMELARLGLLEVAREMEGA